MDVTVQHRDRPKPFEIRQRLPAVLRHPAPLRIDRPERHMGEHHEGSAAGEPLDVLLEPVELGLSEASEPTRLEVEHIDQPDKMDALVVEALPARARRSAEPTQVLLAPVGKDVVLAWYVEDPLGLGALECLGDDVERARLLRVGDVARMDDERGRRLEGLDPGDGLLEGAECILVGFSLEADVRVTDLHEAEVKGWLRRRGRAQGARREEAARGSPDKPCACPGHTLEEPATVHAGPAGNLRVVDIASLAEVIDHGALLSRWCEGHFTMTLPVIKGWRVQKYW